MTTDVGYNPDNWEKVYKSTFTHKIYRQQTPQVKARLRNALSSNTPVPPDYFYRKSPSGITSKFQLMLKVSQFPCNETDTRNKIWHSTECTYCGEAIQSIQHIFLHCPKFLPYRDSKIKQALHLARRDRDTYNRTTDEAELRKYLESCFITTETWTAEPWLGLIPPLTGTLTKWDANQAHHLVIVLTSQIAGEHLRLRAVARAERAGNG